MQPIKQRDSMPLLRRGELAARVGCNLETIRYYEGIGLLPHPPRSQGRHRLYDADLAKRLRFILRGRELGFSIEEIRALLAIADGGGGCADVYALTTQHVEVIRRKIADLRKLQRILTETAARCARDASPECPIIEALQASSADGPLGAASFAVVPNARELGKAVATRP